jgi:hypothetical protein
MSKHFFLVASAVLTLGITAFAQKIDKTSPVQPTLPVMNAPNGVLLAVNATNAQMVEEMKTAVAGISKKYGAPPYAFLFSSDPNSAERVLTTFEEISALKATKEGLQADVDTLKGRIAIAKEKTKKAEEEEAGMLARAAATKEALDKAGNSLRLAYLELQRVNALKDQLEGELADMAVRAEQVRLLLAKDSGQTLAPVSRSRYAPPKGQPATGIQRNIPANAQ